MPLKGKLDICVLPFQSFFSQDYLRKITISSCAVSAWAVSILLFTGLPQEAGNYVLRPGKDGLFQSFFSQDYLRKSWSMVTNVTNGSGFQSFFSQDYLRKPPVRFGCYCTAAVSILLFTGLPQEDRTGQRLQVQKHRVSILLFTGLPQEVVTNLLNLPGRAQSFNPSFHRITSGSSTTRSELRDSDPFQSFFSQDYLRKTCTSHASVCPNRVSILLFTGLPQEAGGRCLLQQSGEQ